MLEGNHSLVCHQLETVLSLFGMFVEFVAGAAGVSGDLKTFFTDVVKAKASPKLRPRSQSDRSRLKVTSLTEQAMRHLGKRNRATPTLSF